MTGDYKKIVNIFQTKKNIDKTRQLHTKENDIIELILLSLQA